MSQLERAKDIGRIKALAGEILTLCEDSKEDAFAKILSRADLLWLSARNSLAASNESHKLLPFAGSLDLSLKKEGGDFILTLPLLPSRQSRVREGRVLSVLTEDVIRSFEEENGISAVPIDGPVLITAECYAETFTKNTNPDLDNLDIKGVIDAMQGRIIKGDGMDIVREITIRCRIGTPERTEIRVSPIAGDAG